MRKGHYCPNSIPQKVITVRAARFWIISLSFASDILQSGTSIKARPAERKAGVADIKTFASKSLGQMTREKRHKLLLYGN